MATQIHLGEIAVDVVQKGIKNIHLSVYPPSGKVRIAAPLRMNVNTIRVFAVSKLGWIKQQQKKILGQERETPREYVDRESHYLWGKRYLLKVTRVEAAPHVTRKHNTLHLQVRSGAAEKGKREVMDAWYRGQLKEEADRLIQKWEKIIGVKLHGFFVQAMKTKWGSANPINRTIRLNAELAKKPKQCLEYLIVHEIIHLIEPTHNKRFHALMDRFMPRWHLHRQELNRLPVKHESWLF